MNHLLELVRAQFQNQFFSGGLVLMVTGAVMALARTVPSRIYHWCKSRLTVEVEILSDDPLFDNITLWLDAQPYSKRSRRLTARSFPELGFSSGNDGAAPTKASADYETEQRPRPRIIFSPAPGNHVFFYKRKLIWLTRNREGQNPQGSNGGSASGLSGIMSFRKYETYSITALGLKQQVIRALVEEAVTIALESQKDKICTYVSYYGSWESLSVYTPRPIESVILPGNIATEVESDVRKFLASREWYAEIGIPWHRGYLLWGIPGSGKTSFVAALAGQLQMNLYLLNLAGNGMDDERLVHLVRCMRSRSILLLEDVDAADKATANRSVTDDPSMSRGVTLSGLLNCLDGLLSRDGSIVFMTTNHRDRLDPATLRAGRVDVSVEFGLASEDQLERIWNRFNADKPLLAPLFAKTHAGKSMAEAQQVLLEAKGFGVLRQVQVDKEVERSLKASV